MALAFCRGLRQIVDMNSSRLIITALAPSNVASARQNLATRFHMPSTQIILTENVPGLGAEADVVKVRRGYARNFLLPTGKAHEVTPRAMRQIDMLKAKRAEREARAIEGDHGPHSQASPLPFIPVKPAKLSGRLPRTIWPNV